MQLVAVALTLYMFYDVFSYIVLSGIERGEQRSRFDNLFTNDQCTYEITVQTGQMKYAGTMDYIFLYIFGEPIKLHYQNRTEFIRGNNDTFMGNERCAKDIPSIGLFHSGKVFLTHCYGDLWYCGRVSIVMRDSSGSNSTLYEFKFDRWFSCDSQYRNKLTT